MMNQLLNDARDFLISDSTPGTETTRSHSWPFSPSVTLLLLAAAAALIAFVYMRERGHASRLLKTVLATIRVLLVILVLFMMYGWMLHRHRTDRPDVVVVVDVSESMSTEDHYADPKLRQALAKRLQAAGLEGLSRLNVAKLLLLENDREVLDELQRRYRLKVYHVGSSARMLASGNASDGPPGSSSEPLTGVLRGLAAQEPASRLGKCVQDVLEMQRGRPTAAVILLSDGVTTEGKTVSEVASYARRKAVPLFLIGLGSSETPRDVRVSDLLVDEVVFVGDLVNFDFKLTATGYEGTRLTVRLRQPGREGPPLAEQQVTAGKDGTPQPVRLTHRPEEKGDFEYVIEVDVLAGEANTDNNRQTRLVKVRDETLRVLFVQAYPSFEFRFLKNLLSRSLKPDGTEKAIALTTVLQEADLEYAGTDATAARVFPVSRDELSKFDVLIFGDVNPSFLSRSVMENVAAFVEQHGGGLVFIAGPKYTPAAYRDTPLATLMPVDPQTVSAPPIGAVLQQGYSPQPTKLGLESPQMQLGDTLADTLAAWRTLPELYWLLEAPDLRPGGLVLAEDRSRVTPSGAPLPVICMQFVGAGKVVFHATDETYRWSRHPNGDQYYARYWIQTLRYLSRSKLLEGGRLAELSSEQPEYRRGEPVRLRARFSDDRLAPVRDDGVTVVVEREGGTRRQITLHRDAASRGVFEGLASNLPEGQYHAWIAAPTLEGQPPSYRFKIVAPPGERARLEMDAADLQLAAKTSQGKFYTLQTASQLLEDLPRGRQVRIESLSPVPIWNSSLLAGLFVVLIATEWLLRKRAGLV